MKYYEGKNNTSFDCDKVPKEGSQCICVSVILIDYVFRIGKTYYPDVLLEKFKYIVKQKRIPKYITLLIRMAAFYFKYKYKLKNMDY